MDAERLQQIEKLYHAVRERAVEERESLLGQADPELRREVESLLKRDGIEGPWDRSAFRLLRNSNMARIAVGTQIGPYRIEALLGVGGMGEVYRARNLRLKQEVALKVLPAIWARDPERTARFQREAEILASLNHPNIAAIHGLEDSDGMQALVMELVEGQSPKGPLPLDDAWHIASQVAAALEYAHDRGIVHRDLKPANIKITGDGLVKLLDFGLAKAFMAQRDGSAGAANPEDSPTLTIGATEAGMILGTAAYMSPEQARGKPVDKRADIWAFGVVFYELLTGERLFQGEDTAEILAAVIHKQPDLSRVPVKARRLLERCLEKDPKKRLRDIGEAAVWLQIGEGRESNLVNHPGLERPLGWIVATALAVLIAASASWIAFRATRPPELKPLVRLDVDPGTDVIFNPRYGSDAMLSPDGTRVVYLSQNKLFTRRLDLPKATELSGADGAFGPFFSPDGHWVAFFDGKKLKKISVDGGTPIVLCDAAPNAMGGSWGDDGNIVVAPNGTTALFRIPSSGGVPMQLTELVRQQATHRWPQVLPGSKAVLFTSHSSILGFDQANIEIVSLSDHRQRTLVQGGTFGRYLPTSHKLGHLIYVNGGRLFAVPFDPEKLELRGSAVPVLEQVGVRADGSAQVSFSQMGTLIYREDVPTLGTSVTVRWLDDTGKAQPLLAKPGQYANPGLSPDAERVVVNVANASGWDVWTYEWRRDTMIRLTFGGSNINPLWSPDGRYIVFLGDGGMFWTHADGSGSPQPLTRSKNPQLPTAFTPDGKRLAFLEVTASTGQDLWTIPLETTNAGLKAGKPELLLQTPFNERHAAFSPDGRWFAYTSNESGIDQVFVRAYPDKGAKWQISNEGGMYPKWSRNGRDLLFVNPDDRIMVARYVVKEESFVADKPRVWISSLLEHNLVNTGRAPFDVAPDGKRVAALVPVETPNAQSAQNHIIFLENFFDELERKAPVK